MLKQTNIPFWLSLHYTKAHRKSGHWNTKYSVLSIYRPRNVHFSVFTVRLLAPE
jgi:hypothetical protein